MLHCQRITLSPRTALCAVGVILRHVSGPHRQTCPKVGLISKGQGTAYTGMGLWGDSKGDLGRVRVPVAALFVVLTVPPTLRILDRASQPEGEDCLASIK